MFATLLGPYPRPTDSSLTRLQALESVLRDQLEAGLGMVTDGHVRTIGAGARPEDLDAIVEAWRVADETIHALTGQLEPGIEPPLVKACLVGPYSAVRAANAAGAPSDRAATPAARRRDTLEAAETVWAVVQALFQAGAAVIQLAEDHLTRIGAGDGAERQLAAEALRRATRDLPGHVTLSVAGGSADAVDAALFFDLPVASYTFDLINGPDNWRLITQAPHDRGIVCGVADARHQQPDDQAVMVWAARYAASTNDRGLERVGLAPSAGLELLPRDAARGKLGALAEAARKAGLPARDLAQEIDPRAIDARSGALGGFDPGVAARLGRRLPGRSPGRSPGSGER